MKIKKKKFMLIMGIVLSILPAVHPAPAGNMLNASGSGNNVNNGNNAYPLTGEAEYVKNRVLVKFAAEESPAVETDEDGGPGRGFAGEISRHSRPAAALSQNYAPVIKEIRYHKYTGYYILETVDNCDIEALSGMLRAEPFVADASPDYYAYFGDVGPAGTPPTGYGYEKISPGISRTADISASTIPNDEYFPYQYALYNTGQIYLPEFGNAGTMGSDIKALDGWQWTTGSTEVIIAVIDSGVAGNHEDLAGKVVSGYNFVHNNEDAYDDHGHGTLAASIAAANTGNGVGIAGVCWHAKIMPVKTMSASGSGSYSNIAAGIKFAADHGAHVINLSIGGRNPAPVLEEACQYAFTRGCAIVACTGNYSPAVLYPAAYDDYCLAVAATDADDVHAPFSNTGPEVDVAAPGYFVWGAKYSPQEPGNLSSYRWDSGTSFSTPYVAGAAALLMSYKPFLTNGQVMTLIKYTADDVNRESLPGIDEALGFGRINLGALLGPYELH